MHTYTYLNKEVNAAVRLVFTLSYTICKANFAIEQILNYINQETCFFFTMTLQYLLNF